jgi:hypothetical protein
MINENRTGEPAEKLVKKTLQAEGWRCLPAKHQRIDTDSAEIIEGDDGAVRNPDIFAFRSGEAIFAEVKQFSSPVKTRARNQYEHGIRRSKLNDYKTVNEDSGIPVFIFIFESGRGRLLASHLSELPELGPIDAERCRQEYGELLTYFPRDALNEVRLTDNYVPSQFPFDVQFRSGDDLNTLTASSGAVEGGD